MGEWDPDAHPSTTSTHKAESNGRGFRNQPHLRELYPEKHVAEIRVKETFPKLLPVQCPVVLGGRGDDSNGYKKSKTFIP